MGCIVLPQIEWGTPNQHFMCLLEQFENVLMNISGDGRSLPNNGLQFSKVNKFLSGRSLYDHV